MTPRAWKARAQEFARQLVLPQQRQLFDYWMELWRGDAWPAHADVRPADMRKLLPHLLIIEPRPAPENMRVRLAGSALWDIYGQEITGGTLQNCLMGRHCAYWRRIYERLLDDMQPDCGHLLDKRRMSVVFWLRLPLQAENGDTWLLGLDMAMPVSRAEHMLPQLEDDVMQDIALPSAAVMTGTSRLYV